MPILAQVRFATLRANQSSSWAKGVAILWRVLSQPQLLLVLAGIALFLVTAGILLPQLPGQYVDEPVAAARWLLATGATYGPTGDLLRNLGLFDVLHSPLLRILLAAIGLVLSVQLADLVGAAVLFHSARTSLHRHMDSQGKPIVLPSYQMVRRRRFSVPSPPETAVDLMSASLRSEFTLVTYHKSTDPPVDKDDNSNTANSTEYRLLGVDNPQMAYARPFLMAGLLLALASAWTVIQLGWQITTPVLAPGDSFRSSRHELRVGYLPPSSPSNPTEGLQELTDSSPLLAVQIGTLAVSRTVSARTRYRLNGVEVIAQESAPAILIDSPSGAKLDLPGQESPGTAVGQVLPQPGSEELILLPDYRVGLRVVRVDDPLSFQVEAYIGSDTLPSTRFSVSEPVQQNIEVDGESLKLRFIPTSGVTVDFRHLPGLWLLWPAGILAGIGAAGFWRRPSFVLIQIFPWPDQRSAVIVQTPAQSVIDRVIRQGDTGMPQDNGEPPDPDSTPSGE